MRDPSPRPALAAALGFLAVNVGLLTWTHLRLRGIGDASHIPLALTGWVILIYVFGVAALAFALLRMKAASPPAAESRDAPGSDALLAGLLQEADALISVKDADGRYMRVNQRFAEAVGRHVEEVVGRTDRELFPKVVADGLYAGDKRALESPTPVQVQEVFKEGDETHTYQARKFCVRDDATRAVAICTIAREQTGPSLEDEQQRLLAMDMFQTQKLEAVGTLAGGLAHDFNNVLTAVLGGLEMAMKDAEQGTRMHKRLTRVQKAARRAADLTKQLLTLSRPAEATMGQVNVNTVVKAATQLLRRSIPDNIEVRTWLTDNPPQVQADGGQVEQALLNLGVNARDAMPMGGRITFETRVVNIDAATARKHANAEQGRYVQITVTDTGTGMPRRVLERIFEPFYTTKEVGKGTGLGLAMVNNCMKAHNGWLSVDSVVGRGTTFALYLPITQAHVKPAPAAAVGDGAAAGDPTKALRGTETVLVVDDEADVRDMARSGLEELGYRVLTAEEGEHAVAVLTQSNDPIDVIVTDLVMPKCGGHKLVKIVRNRGYTMPVLLMTGYVPPSADDVFTEDEFADILNKPFTPLELAARLRKVLALAAAPADVPTPSATS